MFNLSEKESEILKKLNTPKKIQDFLDLIPINFEPQGDTCLSPREVLKQNRAHCIEGALFAALALRIHGCPPLIVDLTSAKGDEDHVIAVFKQHGHWGAISKTNHAVLRYREPIYKTIRELVLSYFHEYFTNHDRKKTLRTYTLPINLKQFDKKAWMTAEQDLWYIVDKIFETKHYPLLNKKQIATLRKADLIEVKSSEILEWQKRLSKNPWKSKV